MIKIPQKKNRALIDLQNSEASSFDESSPSLSFDNSSQERTNAPKNDSSETKVSNSPESLEKKIRRNARITAFSVIVALVGVGFGFWSLNSAQTQVQRISEDCVPTLVCTTNISAGEKISAQNVTVQMIPQGIRSADALGKEAIENNTLTDCTALVALSAGTQLRQAYLAGSGSTNSLASAIKPGYEAISIAVDKETGLASLLHVGDIVRVTQTDYTSSGGSVSTTITNDARVIALDNSLQGTTTYSTVTLEVSAAQADTIREARMSSNVSLTMAGQNTSEASSNEEDYL